MKRNILVFLFTENLEKVLLVNHCNLGFNGITGSQNGFKFTLDHKETAEDTAIQIVEKETGIYLEDIRLLQRVTNFFKNVEITETTVLYSITEEMYIPNTTENIYEWVTLDEIKDITFMYTSYGAGEIRSYILNAVNTILEEDE